MTLSLVSYSLAVRLHYPRACTCSMSFCLSYFASPTAYIILEAVRSQNSRAKRLMVPVFILALASCAEIINYHLKFVASLSLLYQIGTLLFIIIMGIVMGLNISDMLSIKRENERLIFDMNLLEHCLLEQKKYNSLITTNEQLLRSSATICVTSLLQ